MQIGKYHKKAPSLPASHVCTISDEEHNDCHASRIIAELCHLQNWTHDNLVKRFVVSDAADDRLDFFSGDVEWGHVLFPVNVSLLPPETSVPTCNRKANSPATIPAKGIGKFLTHAYAACELCFPKEHKAFHQLAFESFMQHQNPDSVGVADSDV